MHVNTLAQETFSSLCDSLSDYSGMLPYYGKISYIASCIVLLELSSTSILRDCIFVVSVTTPLVKTWIQEEKVAIMSDVFEQTGGYV